MAATELPPLPTLPECDDVKAFARTEAGKAFFGPTDGSNWVVPGLLIAGNYCGDVGEADQLRKLRLILGAGVRVVVRLMMPNELKRFREYRVDMAALARLDSGAENVDDVPEAALPLFCGVDVPDGSTTKDEAIVALVCELVARVRAGELVYVHCWGGHGRTGTVIATMLGRLYDMDAEEALRRCNTYHKCRNYRRSQSPQTKTQFEQVRRLLGSSGEIAGLWAAAEDAQRAGDLARIGGKRYHAPSLGNVDLAIERARELAGKEAGGSSASLAAPGSPPSPPPPPSPQ